MTNNFKLRQCETEGRWLQASGERLLDEQPGIYALALTLKRVPGFEATEHGYTSFVVHIKPGCDVFLHPSPHAGRTSNERPYLILKHFYTVHKRPDSTLMFRVTDDAAHTAGRKLREFMVSAMAYAEDRRQRAEAGYDDDSEQDEAPVTLDGNAAALLELLRLQLQQQAVLERRVRELEAQVARR